MQKVNLLTDATAKQSTAAALLTNSLHWRKLLDNIPIPLAVNSLAAEPEILHVNESFVATFGYTREDIPTVESWATRAYPDEAYRLASFDWWNDTLATALPDLGRIPPREFRVTCKDGGIRDVLISATVQADILLVALIDITERKRMETALREREESLAFVVDGSRLGTWDWNITTGEVWRNDYWAEMLGFSRREIDDATADGWLTLIHPEDRQRAWQSIEDNLAGRTAVHEVEYRMLTRDGKYRWILDRARIVSRDADGRPLRMSGTHEDITSQKQSREQIEHLAYHDTLTGLPNRLMGQDRLTQEIHHASRNQTQLALLYLDLDNFKYVNDTHGHSIGDLLLKAVAERLDRQRRGEDSLCRVSGDEFFMLLPGLHANHAMEEVSLVCERLLASLAAPFDLEGLELFVTCAMGVALYPTDGPDAETLMRTADTALHEAKKQGPGTYRFFESGMNVALIRYVQTREALRIALLRHDFELHYQPQIELRTGRILGMEALLRWKRPGHGLALPGDFITVAEESGLIAPIGRWVLHEACRQAVAWQAAGWRDLVMAVNLSAVQFRHPNLGKEVLTALRETGLDPGLLELELTESILLQGETAVMEMVSLWKAHHIRLAIDDFGTGYSSLAYLKRFKVDKLKIDRSFVKDVTTDEEDRAIVQGIIQIARSLNLRTLAEGVEGVDLAEKLKIMGCDEGQGFLYARPLPAVELEQWLVAHGHPHGRH